MADCPYCLTPGAYDTGFHVECSNPLCKHHLPTAIPAPPEAKTCDLRSKYPSFARPSLEELRRRAESIPPGGRVDPLATNSRYGKDFVACACDCSNCKKFVSHPEHENLKAGFDHDGRPACPISFGPNGPGRGDPSGLLVPRGEPSDSEEWTSDPDDACPEHPRRRDGTPHLIAEMIEAYGRTRIPTGEGFYKEVAGRVRKNDFCTCRGGIHSFEIDCPITKTETE